MKDFHRRKMALRVTMAKELWRRGVPLEEIARTCRPSDEEIRQYKQECEEAIRKESGTVFVPTSHTLIPPVKRRRRKRWTYKHSILVIYSCIFTCIVGYYLFL